MRRPIPILVCLVSLASIVIAIGEAHGQLPHLRLASESRLAVAEREEIANLRTEYGLALMAKLLASGVFVIGRDPQEFIENDLDVAELGLPAWKDIDVSIDRVRKSVTLKSAKTPPRTAIFCGDQGCVLLPRGEANVLFKPVPVTSKLPAAVSQHWPMGDLVVDEPLPAEIDAKALSPALDFAFDDSRQPVPQKTRAMLVVHKGRIVAERYAPGFGKDTRHICWSMGKSITAALIGVLVGEGHFAVNDAAPIVEWQDKLDSRRQITIASLLNMSSGLEFGRPEDSAASFTDRDHHRFVYFGAVDVFKYSINRPVEFPPHKVWRYRNCDPLCLGKIIRQTVEAGGEEYLTFPQRALFDRIGVRNMVLEVDPYGNFIMTGFDYGTARDWARFGLLHLHDGVWDGQRILPDGWVKYISTPAPADAQQHYGGLFWLNKGGRYKSMPRDMYWPAGHHGQVVWIIPSRDMLIVRLGHSTRGGFDEYMEGVAQQILEACASAAN